ncbi:ribonuclease H-like domain-containing protein [Mycena pura]|uniref:ribonuclease H n=1 Tax=Mycena pura TaxID=153505 RepID=A0AAD6YBR7_9AGAR|nr:ribonuclease H-like domain-containing protein [Mycena pura]
MSKSKKRMAPDLEDGDGRLVVYSDGACKGNGQAGSVAGIGVWWGEGDPRNIAERCPGDQTNNRAELIAILRILEETPQSTRPLVIKSDSIYSIKCFTEWINGWIKNNWKASTGLPVKNKELIKYIKAHLDARAQRGQKVLLEHVKGHNGDEGNEGADGLANVGATLPTQPERNWESLEAELHAQLEAERAKRQVEGEQNVGESPAKIRKTSATNPKPKSASREPFKPISTTGAPQAAVSPQRSPVRYSAPTPHGSQELNAYADGWTDDPAADLSF